MDLFHLLKEFEKLHNFKEEVTINLVDDQLQEIKSNTGGLFQLYFYENLFLPLSNRKIIKGKQLNKKTMPTLLNEIFVFDKKENERRIEKYNSESRSTNLFSNKKGLNTGVFSFRNFQEHLL